MLRGKKSFWLMLPFLISLFCFLSVAGKANAKESLSAGIVPVSDKMQSPEKSISVENDEAKKKQPVIQKALPKTDKRNEAIENGSVQENGNNKREAAQDIMERAIELLNNSQESWVKGDIESALDALDQAYAILLDANGDVDIARQKDDLRLLISKKILAIYTSRHRATSGNQSEVPIVMNAEVEREIHSFQTIERDFFIQSFQRASFFRPIILEALKKAGLPEELSWLPLVESGFKIRALSKARALGLWQFIPSTGYKYGLNRDDWVDERLDAEKSTQAAIGYMKDLHDMFGDWLTVLAAYNCGEGRVLRLISGQHINYLDRFWDLYSQLPNETARYVPRFLATLHIIKNPQKYGINLEVSPDKQPVYTYKTVTTNKSMSLQEIANHVEVSEDLLCTLNAELRYKQTPDKQYGLKIPPESAERLINVMDEIPQADKPRPPASRRIALIKHKVKKGETVDSIAKRYKTTVSAIKRYNKSVSKGGVKAGYSLMIPIDSYRPPKATENGKIARKKVQAPEEYLTYKVKKGDTIYSLAKRFDVTVSDIKSMNNIKGDTLKIGNTLKLNKKTTVEDAKGRKTDRQKAG
jgi:membrane-bound lytic murein transglycosylase D